MPRRADAADWPPPLRSLGPTLRRVRLDVLDLTLMEVAERIGASVGYMSQVENGHNLPTVVLLCRWAQALDLSLVELLTRAAEDANKENT